MPARCEGAHLGCRMNKATNMRNSRVERTDKQIKQDNENVHVSMSQLRASQLQEARVERNQQRQLERRQARRFLIETHRANDRQRQQVHRAYTSASFLHHTFEYEPDIEYSAHPKVMIGAKIKECPHCHALKFKHESAGMCCASRKVQLPEILRYHQNY